MRLKLALVVLVSVALFDTALSQSGRIRPNKGSSQDDKDAVRLRAEEVLLPVSVRTDTGKLIDHLSPSDLIVAEDDKRQQITSVLRMNSNVLLILDTSGREVTVKSINKNRQLALNILDSLGSEDQAAILTYADKVNLVSDWTADKKELQKSLNEKFKPGLDARLYESLIFAAHELLPKAKGRRSVILITDGVNTFEQQSFSEALAELHRARATVYVISQSQIVLDNINPRAFNALSWYEMLDPKEKARIQRLRNYAGKIKSGQALMSQLAEGTGGYVWVPKSEEEFLKSNAGVVEEIGTEFVVSYITERRKGDDDFHEVKVYPTNAKMRVRSRNRVYPNNPNEKTGETALPASKN
jgi:VWFA-related protein